VVNRENQSLSKITLNNINNVNTEEDSGNSGSTLPNNDNPIIVVEAPSENKEDENNAWNQFVINY